MSRETGERIAAIVVAAGRSRRMGGQDKLWLSLDGRPLLAHTLAALCAVDEITDLVLVTSSLAAERVRDLQREQAFPWTHLSAVVEGGAERADSVYAGLRALVACDLVLVHDGARPLVTPHLVRAGLAAARAHGAAIPALPLTDTVKEVDAHGHVIATPDRAALRTVQTPQIFRYPLLRQAYEAIGATRSLCTDDAMLLEQQGVPVATFPGDPHNIKVSTPADLLLLDLYRSGRRA